MSVRRRVSFLSQQRVDTPDIKSLESAISNDFDELIKSFISSSQGFVLKGFEISMAGAIGGAASGLQLIVDPGAVFHINSSQSGTFYLVPSGQPAEQLNSATNTIVDGAFTPAAINYVGLEYERFLDDATSAQVYLWNPTTNSETTKTAPRAQILRYRIKITTSTFAANVLPIATVTTNSGNNVNSITDARSMLFRLGQGGSTPNPFYTYPWTAHIEGRSENPPTASISGDPSPFRGGDKMLMNLKDWVDAVMTSLQEIKGTTYWYSTGAAGSIESLREDFGNTITTGKGGISHSILPNTTAVLVTTGNISVGSDQLTSLASVVGIVAGQVVMGTGITADTTVLSIIGSTVTLSRDATLTTTGVTVSFFSPSVVTSAGQVNWDEDIFMKVVGSRLYYKILANASSSYVTLADNQVAYINLVRGVAVTPNLIFANPSAVVTSVGSVAWTSLLQAGDWIKLSADTDAKYYQILTVDSLIQVTLTETFAGVSTGTSGAKAKYAFGTYQAVALPTTNRHIWIDNRTAVPMNQDAWWLFLRADNGLTPRVYVRFIGAELEQGEAEKIDNGVSRQLLQYIGSPLESSRYPQYASALNPGSLPEIRDLKVGAASAITSNQYFLINSSADQREYYVWFNKDGTGVDPVVPGKNASVEVIITTGQTAQQVATALANALSNTQYNDFDGVVRVFPDDDTVRTTNNSAGTCVNAVNFNVGAPFTRTQIQEGTGAGNHIVQDGDDLTLAIKKLDDIVGAILSSLDDPNYDETVDIVASGEVPPISLNGPIVPTTLITLPDNSRLASIPQFYTVGHGTLMVFLNGQYLRLGIDWNEVGVSLSASDQIEILQTLAIGDSLEFRICAANGAGGGGGGGIGPAGPPGSPGPASGDPISISTKISSYPVLVTDDILLADCSAGAVTFTLPLPASSTGKIFYFKKIDATANAMNVSSVSLVDGLGSQSTTVQYEFITVTSDGTTFWVIG